MPIEFFPKDQNPPKQLWDSFESNESKIRNSILFKLYTLNVTILGVFKKKLGASDLRQF